MSKKNCTPGDELEIPLTLVLDYSDFNATYPIGNIPAWEVTLKVVFYIIAMVLDIVGNSIIIFIIILNRKMRTTTNVLILNLAVSDLFVGIFCMWIHMGNQIDSNWPFGSFMCKFTNFSQVMSVTASVLTLTIISVERFIAIVYPFKAKWSALTTVIVIVCTWVAAIATASPHLFVRHLFKTLWQDREDRWCAEVWTQYYKDRDCNTWPRGKVVYYCVEGIVMYFLPIVIMIVTYSIISVRLLHRRAPGSLINSTSSAQDKSKKKVIKMLVAVLVVFTLCWTPQQTLLLMSVLGKPTTRSDIKYTAVFVAYFNSALNPILYGGFNENFRKGFSEAFKCVLVQKRNKIGIDSTARSMAPHSKIMHDPHSFNSQEDGHYSALSPAASHLHVDTKHGYSNTLQVPVSTVYETQGVATNKTPELSAHSASRTPETMTSSLKSDIFVVKCDS